MVFVQRKGMAFRVRHGRCTKKEHGLLAQAWSFYTIQSSTVMFSSFHCPGSHHYYCLSGIVCAFMVAFFFSRGIVISVKMKRYAIFIFSSVKKTDCSDFD